MCPSFAYIKAAGSGWQTFVITIVRRPRQKDFRVQGQPGYRERLCLKTKTREMARELTCSHASTRTQGWIPSTMEQAPACNQPSDGEAETGEFLGLTGQLAQPNSKAVEPGSTRDSLKKHVESD